MIAEFEQHDVLIQPSLLCQKTIHRYYVTGIMCTLIGVSCR